MPHRSILVPSWPKHLCVGLGLYVVAGGLVSLAGWYYDLEQLTSWLGDFSIQPNAALCSIFAGAAVCLLAVGWRRLGGAFGALTLALASLTIVEWLAGVDLGIDDPLTFGREWGRLGLVHVGRMGPPASLSFTLVGLGLCLTASRLRRWRASTPALGMVTLAVGVLAITGQLYGADALYSLPRASVIASQTSTFLVALAIALIALHPQAPPMRWLLSTTTLGAIARRAVPAVVIAPIALGWLRLQGERMGYYDTAFGTALLVLMLIAMLGVVLWRGLSSIAEHEAALLDSEERVQLAVMAGDAATWDLDLRNGSNARSDSYYTLLGYDPEPARRGPDELWTSVVLADDLPAVLDEWRCAREERRLFRMEYRARRADGSVMWVRSAGRFLYDDAGRPVRFVGVYVDITGEQQAIEQLREVDRRKDEFIAMLAHELRNPLAPVRNAVAILKARGPAVPELQWARDVIDRQVQQMSRLIEDLLDTSRIRGGKIELRRERVDVANVIHGAVEASRPLIEQHHHTLVVGLPQEPAMLDGDLVRLSQVFCNLLNNAARYTPDGGRIELNVTRRPMAVEVSVRDDGIGIPRDMLPRVFDMFTQVDRSLERTRGGLGLGLTLVKQLVELHGGEVEARSDGPGHGCEFVVRLPLALDPVVVPRAASAARFDHTGAPPRTVLIVDDNEDAARSLAQLLEAWGHRTWTAFDGLEGLRLAREVRPEIVLLDLGMPKLNGFDCAAAIRREPWGRDVLLAAMTGWGQEHDRARSREAGFDEHLVKPVAEDVVHEVLGRRRGHTAAAPSARPTAA